MNGYVPLNVRSSYSIGESICQVPRLVRKAREMGLSALAIADANMCGVKEFHTACRSRSSLQYGSLPSIKPIIGLRVWIRERGVDAPLVLLAKSKTGYRNLVRFASEAKLKCDNRSVAVVPLAVVLRLGDGMMCLAGGKDLGLAEACYKRFAGDFAFMAERDDETFPNWPGVDVCAAPPVRFIDKGDAEAYDAYCAINDHRRLDAPGARRCRGVEYLMTEAELSAKFRHHPEWIRNAQQLAQKIEDYELDEAPEAAEFPIPPEFPSSMAYLRHLVAKGAAERWGMPLPAEVSDRLDFELSTIEHFCDTDRRMDFASYFLIVQDYVAAARRMGAWVGPGRGSAAGSAVAYVLGITGVDPIKHGLLFERFLNPDRISMPDIDIDFDDAGRSKVAEYIGNKYGRDHVAHIVTFGQMAPKSAIKDVSRAVGMSIGDANRLARLVPQIPRITFNRAYRESKRLRNVWENGNDLEKKVLRLAERLEGCVRQSGIHACGIVLSRRPLSEVLPVTPIDEYWRTPNGIELVTQYDGRCVEQVGLLKFDILGQMSLSVHKNCIELIKERMGQNLDLEKIPDNDPKAMQVFASGDTTGIFQFELEGMRKWLRALKPASINDIVAISVLYRPGLMEYIPAFIRRKNGEEPIAYDHPLMERFLRETYGVTIYQEQVMLLSRLLAGFTRSESDKMRKAMGLKRLDILEDLKSKFIEGCLANPSFRIGRWVDEAEARKLAGKIWNDWSAVASYVFNKSHAVAYAWLAYQSAYLKAHYPKEFMLGRMRYESGNMTRLPELLQEARRMGIQFTQAELDMVQYRP